MPLEQYIVTYGYLVIALGTFFEGETVLIMGGFLAHRGYLHLSGVIAAAFLGAVTGDQVFYWIGRTKGAAFLDRRVAWQSKIERLRELLRAHRTAVILGFRFLYGLRAATPFFLGTSGIPPLRFAVVNCIGAAAWAVLIGTAGYFVGATIELFLVKIRRYEMLILGAILLVGSLLWMVRIWREKRQQ